MKKLLYIIISVFLLASCYEDKGNYDYIEINELDILGIEKLYNLDVDETLVIEPQLKGTKYSDTSRFDIKWEIGRRIVSNKIKLEYTGERVMSSTCRLRIKDRETDVEDSFIFELNVSSSTAADAILVLSNYKGHAELSYLRVDKDDASFVKNYYFEKNEEFLGTNPVSMCRNYFTSLYSYPGIQILTDEGIKNIDANTLNRFKYNDYIDTTFFLKHVPPYPKTEIEDYEPVYVNNYFGQYRRTPYGSIMKSCYMDIIAGGRYFGGSFNDGDYRMNLGLESPHEGALSSCTFSVYRKPRLLDLDRLPNIDVGYDVSLYTIMFDKTNGRFVYYDRERYIYEIEEFESYAYKGFDLTYGSHTSEYNTCYAVLTKDDVSKIILMKAPGNYREQRPKTGTPQDPSAIVDWEILGDMDINKTLMNKNTEFYTESYGNYMYFSTGNSFYKYNFKNIALNMPPTPSDKVFDLTNYGYDSNAKINAMFVTRTEKTIILAVSRYGSDTMGNSEELKGDILLIDNTGNDYNLIKKYEAVSGYPVDVMIKYREFYRDGKDFNYELRDKY